MIKKKFWLILASLLIFPTLGASEVPYPEVPRIDAKLAYLYYKTGKAILVDAMDRTTFNKKRILGSINLPNDGPQDLEKIRNMEMPFQKEMVFIVYCE
jgi:hypothetical protein